MQQIEGWADWPVRAALLVGPRKSGRTLLGRAFLNRTRGILFDDAERGSETDLFHAWNRAQADRRPLLIIADEPPPTWEIRLPDLRSRIAATPLLRIGPPDDPLVADLMQYLFDRRELVIAPELIRWLARRVERTYLQVLRVVEAMEEDAMIRGTRILSMQGARAALAQRGWSPPTGEAA